MSTVKWYVLQTRFHQELAVQDSLRHAGLHCYVPLHYKVDTVNNHKIRRLVPAINNLVFVHATEESINEFKMRSK